MPPTAARTLVAAVACGALAFAGCSRDKKSSAGGPSTTSSTAATSTSAPASTTTTGGTLTGAALTPVSTPVAGPALLSAVRTSTNGGFDRVVFEFEHEAPGYAVRYIDRPVREDGSGNEVTVRGGAVLEVRMEHASGADLSGGKFRQTYTGPRQIEVDGAAAVEVVRTGDFEGVLHWVIGTTTKLPFKVSTLSGPNRIVVDIARPSSGG